MAPLDDFALLVDAHTLDSYVALAALTPRRPWLLHAPAYARHAGALAAVTRERLGVDAELIEVSDDTDASVLASVWAALPGGTHLHHTGGTGAMAALLYGEQVRAGGSGADVSWLDEGRRMLRRGDGTDRLLTELIDPAVVDVAVIFALQGFQERADRHDAGHRALVADVLAGLRPRRSDTGSRLIEQISRELQRRVASSGSRHSLSWATGGGFFEHVVEHVVREVAPAHDTRTGVAVQRDLTQVELDVVAVGHFRPYVISCTRGGKPETIKHKMFEVLLRAQQVGGLTARSAVACTLSDGATIAPSSIESLARWSPLREHQPLVFGDSDVAGWLRGEDAALARLEAFLTD